MRRWYAFVPRSLQQSKRSATSAEDVELLRAAHGRDTGARPRSAGTATYFGPLRIWYTIYGRGQDVVDRRPRALRPCCGHLGSAIGTGAIGASTTCAVLAVPTCVQLPSRASSRSPRLLIARTRVPACPGVRRRSSRRRAGGGNGRARVQPVGHAHRGGWRRQDPPLVARRRRAAPRFAQPWFCSWPRQPTSTRWCRSSRPRSASCQSRA